MKPEQNIETTVGQAVNVDAVVSTFFVDPETCGDCGGKCCKRHPGVNYPSDFDSDAEISEAIKSGRFAVDWWEGDPGDGDSRQAYFVRPATKGMEGKVYDASWGGECTFLTKRGCSLEPRKRPQECRDLEPKAGRDCIMHNNTGKRNAAIAWRKHFLMLDSFEC